MKRVTTIFAIALLFALASLGTSFASNISKTFEFGPGKPYASSIVKTFSIPCGLQVAAVVKYTRFPSGVPQVPITVEFREPDISSSQEGPIISTRALSAGSSEETTTIFSPAGSGRGCSFPWRVRVRHTSPGPSPYVVSGTIRLDYNGNAFSIPSSAIGSLLKGASKTVNLGDVTGLKHGKLEVKAHWVHEVFGVPADPENIKLRFELLDPVDRVVQSAESYSGNLSPNLSYSITGCMPGQWKLKITNTNNFHDAHMQDQDNKFTPGC